MTNELPIETARNEVLEWLLRGVDPLDSVDATAALDKYAEHVRKEMAWELAEWLRKQAQPLGASRRSDWKQVAKKIDPYALPTKNGLRSYWNQEDWNV